MDYLRNTARSNISPLEYGQMDLNARLELFLYRAASEIGFARALCATDVYRPSEWPNEDTDLTPIIDGMMVTLANGGIVPQPKSMPSVPSDAYRVIRMGLAYGYQEALKIVAAGIPATTQERWEFYAAQRERDQAS